MRLCYGIYESPIGTWTVLWGPRGLQRIIYGEQIPDNAAFHPQNWEGWRQRLQAWFAGECSERSLWQEKLFDLSGKTDFQRNVWACLCMIPRGEVRTYGDIARQTGSAKAARAVGQAVARNPIPLLIPCHRVVPAHGGVGHYSLNQETQRTGQKIKTKLLQWEGAQLDQIPIES